jgi:hypothetical protein
MNVSMPREVRGLVRQAAISTAAVEREGVDDSAWIVRAICEKLQRDWESLGLGQPMPEAVRRLASRPRLGTLQLRRVGVDEEATAF